MELSKFNNMSSEQGCEYAKINGPTPELENIIATDVEYSYLYADNVLKGKFTKGEKIIATSADYSYWYAYFILDKRFSAGEQTILKDFNIASVYAKTVMYRRWLKAEPIIRTGGWWNEYKEYFNIGT